MATAVNQNQSPVSKRRSWSNSSTPSSKRARKPLSTPLPTPPSGVRNKEKWRAQLDADLSDDIADSRAGVVDVNIPNLQHDLGCATLFSHRTLLPSVTHYDVVNLLHTGHVLTPQIIDCVISSFHNGVMARSSRWWRWWPLSSRPSVEKTTWCADNIEAISSTLNVPYRFNDRQDPMSSLRDVFNDVETGVATLFVPILLDETNRSEYVLLVCSCFEKVRFTIYRSRSPGDLPGPTPYEISMDNNVLSVVPAIRRLCLSLWNAPLDRTEHYLFTPLLHNPKDSGVHMLLNILYLLRYPEHEGNITTYDSLFPTPVPNGLDGWRAIFAAWIHDPSPPEKPESIRRSTPSTSHHVRPVPAVRRQDPPVWDWEVQLTNYTLPIVKDLAEKPTSQDCGLCTSFSFDVGKRTPAGILAVVSPVLYPFSVLKCETNTPCILLHLLVGLANSDNHCSDFCSERVRGSLLPHKLAYSDDVIFDCLERVLLLDGTGPDTGFMQHLSTVCTVVALTEGVAGLLVIEYGQRTVTLVHMGPCDRTWMDGVLQGVRTSLFDPNRVYCIGPRTNPPENECDVRYWELNACWMDIGCEQDSLLLCIKLFDLIYSQMRDAPALHLLNWQQLEKDLRVWVDDHPRVPKRRTSTMSLWESYCERHAQRHR